MILSPVFAANFPPSHPGWPDDPTATAWFAADGYHLSPRLAGRFVAVTPPAADLTLGDSVVTATFRKLGGPPGGGYGVIARDTDSVNRDGWYQAGRFYVAEVDDQGDVGIWRREQDHWVDLVPWTRSAAVHTGFADNEIQLRIAGGDLVLVVNGMPTAGVRDSAVEEGGVGLFVGGDGNNVLVSAFSVDVPTMQ